MKIVCCIHSLSGGGAEHLMAGLAGGLAERHEVVLVTLAHPRTDQYPLASGVARVGADLVGTSASTFQAVVNNVRRVRALRRLIRARRPDVVLSFCDQMNVATLMACRPLRIPTVVSEMTDPRFHRLPTFWRWLRPWAYRRAAAVVAISWASVPEVSRLHGRPAVFIPPAVDPVPANLVPDRPAEGRFRLAAVGRLSAEKRWDWLIRAFSRIAPRHPQWDLEIVGAGTLHAELESLVERLGLGGRVRLRGRVPEVWSFLTGAHAFAFASQYEGTPVALLEALSVGLPAVAVNCDSGINEVLEDRLTGLLVDNSLAALTAGLDDLLADGDLRARLAAAAPRAVIPYTWPRFIARYEDLLHNAAHQSR